LARTALVILVPEAESVVAEVRARHDPSVLLRVPAHVTLLFPFMPPEAVSASVESSLRGLFAGFDSFPVCFAEACRWPAEAYLAPRPSAPFVALTRGIEAMFPEYPPYGGRHADIIPHLTVAQGSAAAAEQAEKEISAVLAEAGPIQSICRAATLLEDSGGPWRVMHTYAFAPVEHASLVAASPKDCRTDL
jgi:2'-5' RNA ligase